MGENGMIRWLKKACLVRADISSVLGSSGNGWSRLSAACCEILAPSQLCSIPL